MTTADPEFLNTQLERGRALIGSERWRDADPVYSELMRVAPDNVSVRYDYATVKLGIGECETALEIFDALIRGGTDQAVTRFMRARAFLELGQIDKGIADLEDSWQRQPADYCLRALANAYWMQGDTDAFERVLDLSLEHPVLLGTATDMLRLAGHPQKVVETISAARSRGPVMTDAICVLAQALLDLDRPAEAEQASREGLAASPGNETLIASLITACLMSDKASEALEISQAMRQLEPDRQHWIAYEATAWRLLGDERYDSLVDLDRFVRPFELPVPPGYETINAFNAALLDALDRWQPYAAHPLNQTLRNGIQTTRELTEVDDPVIQAYFQALDQPIRAYMAEVGSGDEHPLTARNTGDYRFAGSWSVRLRGGGRHVNHVHPEGWISSAYYVAVPDDVDDEESRAGWIKFGEPPFECRPAAPPQKWVKPAAGTLVLFPSYLWHGTAPIFDTSERVTAPFDVVPA